MEKYGFVYIWYDRKHKRYYVGCHWGYENDGYICSSNWMRMSHKRRPNDFKRRIIKKVYDREILFKTEAYYLNMIKKDEFGKKYYNLQTHWNHWSEKEQTRLSVSEKISIRTKEAMQRPEVREKYLEGLKTRFVNNSDEVREKRRKSMIGKNVGKDNSKAIRMAAKTNRGKKHSAERIQQIKDTTIFKTLNNTKVSCIHCGFIGNVGNVARYHNDKCKKKDLNVII